MKPPSILIAIPCYGGMVQDHTVSGLYRIGKYLESKAGIKNELVLISNQSLISLGRSNIANFFINETKNDYIMCIDADIGFEWTDVVQLIEHQKEFVTGAYSMKIIPPKYNFQIHESLETDGKLVRLAHIGTGFQLVHRSVFEDISKQYPELKVDCSDVYPNASSGMKDNSYHYYDTMIDGGMISEDISFCRRYNKTGGKIWLDPTINLLHGGNHVFTGIDNFEETIHNVIEDAKCNHQS